MEGIPAEVILQLLQVTVAHEALPVTARRVPALLATVEGRIVRQATAEAVVVVPQVAEAAILAEVAVAGVIPALVVAATQMGDVVRPTPSVGRLVTLARCCKRPK